jgi:hypothetical protein
MASTVRAKGNEEILAGIWERMTGDERRGLLRLVDVVGLDGKSLWSRRVSVARRSRDAVMRSVGDRAGWGRYLYRSRCMCGNGCSGTQRTPRACLWDR